MKRRFVGSADTSEVRHLAGARFLIQSFWIALFTNLERRVDPDFDKVSGAGRFQALPDHFTITTIRTDECQQCDDAGMSEQFRHRAHTANILLAIHGSETQTKPGGKLGAMI